MNNLMGAAAERGAAGDLASGLSPASRPMSPAAWGWLIALLGWSAALSFYHLSGGAGFEPTDCWVAQTAREMRQNDEWVVPQFADETRMQKSPGPYWVVMLIAEALGRPVDEVAARLPNAVAAVLLAVTIFWLTRRVAGDRAAVFAGFASAGSVFLLHWAKRGASDLGLAALITLALAALWIGMADEPRGSRKRFWLIVLGYFAAGLGMLYKMPMPLACVGLPMAVWVVVGRRWRDLWEPAHLVGVFVFLLPWLPWVLAVLSAEPTAFAKWKVEFLDRFTGKLPNVADQQTDVAMYFMYLVMPVVFCLPFSLSLPGALWRGVRPPEGTNRGGMRFQLIWFLSLLAFFTASAGKEWRYLLPGLPPLFVLLGVELALLFDPRRRIGAGLIRLGTWTAVIGVPAGFVAAGYVLYDRWYPQVGAANEFTWAEVLWPFLGLAIIFTLGAWLSAGLFAARRRNMSFGALVATMFAAWLWVWPQLMPIMVSQRPFVDLAEQMERRLTPAMKAELRFIGSQDSRLIWYTDIRIPRLIDQLELLEQQGLERNLQWEKRQYAEKMMQQLSGAERVLYVATLADYAEFRMARPELVDELDMPMPRTHIWLSTRLGPPTRVFVIFSNKPRPAEWGAVELHPRVVKLLTRLENATTQPG